MDKKYNVFEINSIFFLPGAMTERLIPEEFQHRSQFYLFLSSIILLIKSIIGTILKAPLKYKFAGVKTYCHLYDGTILFRLPSLNNIRSLQKVINKLQYEKANVVVIDKVQEYDSYPILLMDLVSLYRLPILWREFKRLNRSEKRIVCYFIQHFVLAQSYVWFYKKMLEQYKPECVVMANDHTFITKPLELLCEDYHIPCIYVQHASVSYDFPELHFSHSFLDGTDALKKYTSGDKKTTGNIILLGACRYDALSEYRLRREHKRRGCIGMAINTMDDNQIADSVCNELLRLFPNIRIKIRMHPTMKEHPFEFTNKERITYTCATDESMLDYLDSIDVQISNDSGVHLDAILGGVRTIAYNLSHYEYGDNYEYLKNGLICLATDINQLVSFMKDNNTTVDTEVVRLYDESYNKSYSGHCSDIISDFILSGFNMEELSKRFNLKVDSVNGYKYYYIPDTNIK